MKSFVIVKLSLLSLVAISAATQSVPAGSSTLGVFVGSSPCDAVSRSLLKVPEAAKCELIKWHLTLRQDPGTPVPAAYKLTYTYGLPRQGTTGLVQGGTRVEREGRWSVVRGAARSPRAIVYRLDPDKPSESVSFLKLDQNLIHLLDRDGKLAVGNAGWSYTLNTAGDSGRRTHQASPLPASALKAASPLAPSPPVASGSPVVGAFVGRSPCREVAAQLNKAVGADCVKAKWELTLHRDPDSLAPTTYSLRGTFYRERIREGRWAIVRGTKADQGAVVYQLDPDKPGGSLLLLRADDNVLLFLDEERNLLVGNGDFSYSLNRAKDALKN